VIMFFALFDAIPFSRICGDCETSRRHAPVSSARWRVRCLRGRPKRCTRVLLERSSIRRRTAGRVRGRAALAVRDIPRSLQSSRRPFAIGLRRSD
jgi:hypothetical protein